MIEAQVIADLRERADIVAIVGQYIALQKDGNEYVGLCPFHKEDTPSFKVSPKGYVCFGCKQRGDVIRFVGQIENLSFPKAIARVAELCGEDAPAPMRVDAPARVKAPRGPCVAKYSYHDPTGKLAYEIRRYEPGEDGRKKTFLPHLPGAQRSGIGETQRYLYNLPAVLASPEVWIVEGEKDANTLIKLGLVATTAPFGANDKWRPEYTEWLKGKRCIVIPDWDEAGRRHAGEIAGALLFPPILKLPEKFKDVTEFAQAGGTVAQLRAMIPGQTPSPPVVSAPVQPPHIEFPEWREMLIKSNNGVVKACLGNAMDALRLAPEWSGALRYNAFAQRVVAVKPTPWGFAGDWEPEHDTKLTNWLHHESILVNTNVSAEVVECVARDSTFHPVREYLNSVAPVWDHKPRLHSWLVDYMGADPASYGGRVGEIGAKWMIQCVARIFNPGCKAHACIVLEGKQGKGKSSALGVLGGEWFSDNIPKLGTKDSQQYLPGVWIIEIQELDRMTTSEVGDMKSFMTCAVDRYRPSYGRRTMNFPRQQSFCASINGDTWNRDETGARRFWPVKTSKFDLGALQRDRDQLWAEAVLRFRLPETWWIDDDELLGFAQAEQADRYIGDAWDDPVSFWLMGKTDCSVSELLTEAIRKDMGQWTAGDKMRMGKILTSMKWTKYRCSSGIREWRYAAPE